ncbi:DUF5791 family protein [Halococcus qingdaonensis]|uniref:DUF5791 family protein n=1 Tax=Halococcus qingdaonensis TaxID=224402 RepID=UPI002116DA66|nr:DUF5791 family protein [Halococcus qingdaonensis]
MEPSHRTSIEPTNRVDARCDCEPSVESSRLLIDASDCVGDGRIATTPACRATAIAALDDSITEIEIHDEDCERRHDEGTVGMLLAAARFAALVADRDATLARRAHREPLVAARAALARGGRVGELAAVTGLAEALARGYGVTDELNPLTSGTATGAMFHDVENAGELTPDELRARYDELLRSVVESHGSDTIREETGVEGVGALTNGESPSLTLDEAAAVLALDPEEPDADAIAMEARDHLLMGMTTAVLDVEALESGIDGALDAREIQQKIEGRLAMELDEFALLHGYIEERKP